MDLAERREGSESARVRVKSVRGVLPRGFCDDSPAPQLGLFILLVSLLLLKIHTCLMLVRLMPGCGPSAAWLVSRYHVPGIDRDSLVIDWVDCSESSVSLV